MDESRTDGKLATNIQFLVFFISLLTIFAVCYVLAIAKGILIPFALAVFVSYILYPVIEFFEKLKIPGFISTLLSIILFIAIFYIVVHLISGSISSFSSDFEKYEPKIQKIQTDIESFLALPADFISGQGESTIQSQITENLSIGGFISTVVSSVSSILSNIFFIILILLFMLMGRKQMMNKVKFAFNEKTSDRISTVLKNVNIKIQRYIVAKSIISLITAILFVIVLSIFGVEFIIIWGILAFVLNFIPNIGSLLSTILPLTVAYLQFDDTMTVVWIALILIIIQQVMGNIVEPKVLGKSVNLSPLVILFSLVFWGWLWGIIGMFLSVPIAVIIKIILENIEGTRPIAIMMGSGKK